MRSRFFLAASVVLMLAFVFILGTAAAQPASPCDPAYVARTGKVLRVSPTGVDDTANIQCAFDWANDIGPGMTVHLQPGTFHTAQILVVDFHGAFKGSGRDQTTIVNLPDLYVIPDIETIPPSADNPWPNLFIFIDSDVDVSNLAIRIFGESPVTAWYIGEFGPFYQFGTALLVSGTESHFNVWHVSLEGERSATSPIGYNVFNGINFNGYVTTTGVDFEPLSGSYTVRNSSFKTIGWPTVFANLNVATVRISHNTYADVQFAVDGEDLVDSTIRVFNNRILTNDVGIAIYNFMLPQDVNTDYRIFANTIKGPTGIAFFTAFDEDSTCRIMANNLTGVTDTPIFLSPDTEACVLKGNRE